MSIKFLPVKLISETSKRHTGTVIFFHGSGDTGEGAKEWIKYLVQDFQFPHLQVLFPTAPKQPYTPLNGELSNVWFDRLHISPDVPEHTDTLESIGKDVKDFIEHEVIKSGTPINRIVVGGFSMGGALAMHIGYRLIPHLAGVFVLSSFLGHSSSVYEVLSDKSRDTTDLPPLFMCHGDRDTLVPLEWGEHTFKTLKQLGIQGEFHTITNALHELKRKELQLLQKWIHQCLPPLPDS